MYIFRIKNIEVVYNSVYVVSQLLYIVGNIDLQCWTGLKLNRVHYNSVKFSVDEWWEKMILVKLIVKLYIAHSIYRLKSGETQRYAQK